MKPNQLKNTAFIFLMAFLANYSAFAKNCISSTTYSISEIYNNGDGTSDYEIDLCAEVNGSPRPKRIVYTVTYDTDGDGNKESNLSFEFDPPGNHISNGTYCLSSMSGDESFVVTVPINSTVELSIVGYKSNSGNGGKCEALSEEISVAPLPVELVDFSAKSDNEQVLLEWTTASEIDNDYFAIEQSTDGAEYRRIGEVDGIENSLALQRYNFVDETPVVGNNFYRLRQVDADGGFEFSDIRVATIREVGEYLLYPTLSKTVINLDFEHELNHDLAISISNLNGQVVMETLLGRGQKRLTISTVDLAKGLHVISFGDEFQRFLPGKFMKV